MEFSKKFGCSVTLLSLLAVFAGYFSFTLSAILFVLVLAFAAEEQLRNNVSVTFILNFIYTVVSLIISKISGSYANLLFKIKDMILKKESYGSSKYETVTKVFEWLQNLNAFKIINNVLGFAMLVITIVFVVMVFTGKPLKFPGISKLVEKNVKKEKED